ncbi:MAG TPA: hypothetical protein VHZ03_52340 [Trebonia sp.]|nr:hypothetical protein [Trebonia sp.]
MIVRILGEGQYEVSEAAAARLQELDRELEAAVEAGDDAAFKAALSDSVDVVRSGGSPVPADSLHTAEIILPASDADVAEALKLLTGDQVDG